MHAWCWLRIAASPTLVGGVAGAIAYGTLGGALGVVLAGAACAAGLVLGVRLANYAARRTQLVEFAHGLPPSTPERADD